MGAVVGDRRAPQPPPAVERGSHAMHVLLHDDLGRLTLRRLRPWHRVLARSRAARLDRELAEGKSPEASATLAARAMRLTSTDFRRDLAASLQRILAAAGKPPAVMASQVVAARPPYPGGAAMPGRVGPGYPAGRPVGAAHPAPPGTGQPVRSASRRAGQLPSRARPGTGARCGDGEPAAGRRHGPALP